jgi:hypothetical protein
MKLGNWSEDIHKDVEQVKRIDSAMGISPADVTVDTKNETAVIVGSFPYEVSLVHCTCEDFSRRNLPCKHIYRLASELGYLTGLPQPNRKAAKAFKESIPSEIKRFEALYEAGAISGKKYVAIVKALQSK